MTSNIALSTFTSSALVVYVIQKLKASEKFPWITDETKKVRVLLSAIGAAAASAGISWSWNPATHTAALSGLTISAVAIVLWRAAGHFSMQEVLYAAINGKGELAQKVAAAVVKALSQAQVLPPASQK